jgi:hypothetical protein
MEENVTSQEISVEMNSNSMLINSGMIEKTDNKDKKIKYK